MIPSFDLELEKGDHVISLDSNSGYKNRYMKPDVME